MKNLLLLTIALIMMSCESSYINTFDTADGELISVSDRQHLTKIGDTLILSSTLEMYKGYSLYGKYIGVIPESYIYYQTIKQDTVRRTVVFTRVVRLE